MNATGKTATKGGGGGWNMNCYYIFPITIKFNMLAFHY